MAGVEKNSCMFRTIPDRFERYNHLDVPASKEKISDVDDNRGRFSFVVMCPDIVLKITSIDEATRSEIERLMSAACDDDATEHVSIAEEKHFSAVSDEKETDGGAQRIRGGGGSAASTVKNSDYDPISSFFEKQGFDWQQFWNTVWYFCQQNPRYSMNLCSLASFSGTRKQLG